MQGEISHEIGTAASKKKTPGPGFIDVVAGDNPSKV